MTLDDIEILQDFALCEDVTDICNFTDAIHHEMYWGACSDERMSSDNLRIFKIVKLPKNELSWEKEGFSLRVGDKVLCIALGFDVKFDDGKVFKMHELKYITAKFED